MAKTTKVTAQELLTQTCTPHVAVLASPAAQTLCSRNNLNFTQLIKPFAGITVPGSWQEPNGGQITPKGLQLTFVDIGSWKPPQLDTQKNRKVLYGKVAQSLPPPYEENSGSVTDTNTPTQLFRTCKLGKPGYTEEYLVKVPSLTPWFDNWRRTFLHINSEQESSQHEFLSHFVACFLVISSSEAKSSEDCVSIIGKLSKLQLQHQTEWPNTWILPSTLKYYLILNDVNTTSDSNLAEELYQKMRITYGGNFCYMLKINNSSPNNPDSLNPNPWSSNFFEEKLISINSGSESAADVFDSITATSNDMGDTNSCAADFFHPLSPENELPPSSFVTGSNSIENGKILPASSIFSNSIILDQHQSQKISSGRIPGQFLTSDDARNIQNMINEFLSKALLPYIERQVKLLYETILNRRSMSKSFFGATKRLFGSGKALSSIVYGADTPEMISRKLADLYFLFGHYPGAYQFYHQLKKDFQGDQAWVYYASALEMAAISHFMMTQSDSPVQGARSFPVHYVNEAIRVYMENCRMTDAAIRCALLCCECLTQIENYGEAAAVYIRMTSEECDLRSALMLEQASYAFLNLNSPRKYALHCVLAGNRYSKAALRTHSLNCYHQARQIYSGKGWRFAEDHVHFTMIKHKSFLKINQGLATYFKALLKTPTPQPVTQVEAYYKEFLFSMARLHEEDKAIEEFHVPKIIANDLRIRIGNPDLEVGEIEHVPSSFEDVMESYWDTLEEQVVKECIDESVIRFKPSRLLFENGTDNTVHPAVPANECLYIELPIENSLPIKIVIVNLCLHFEPSATVKSKPIKQVILEPMETKTIRFAVSSSKRGRITFESLTYSLKLESLSVPFKQTFKLKGPRLNKTKAEKAGKVYAKDMRNEINVIEQMPLVQTQVNDLPPALYQSQSINFNINLQDKCNDPEERKRITRVILACDHMTDHLEINRTEDLDVEGVQKNYTMIKANFDEKESMRIPITFKSPQNGDVAVLRILVVYQVAKRNEDHLHSTTGHTLSTTPPASSSKLAWEPIHRVIKVVVKVPLLPCLRLEYSLLKPIDALTRLGLLRIHNMTQTSHLEISEVEFNMPSILIERIVSSDYVSNSDKFRFIVGPNESRNIVIQTKEVKSEENILENTVKHRLYLFAHWKFTQLSSDLPVSPVGMYKLRIKWKDELQSVSNASTSFIIQIHHPSRVSHDFNQFPCYISPITLLLSSKIKGRICVRILRNETDRTEGPSGRISSRASSQDVYFVGQTKWILDVEPNETYKINCNAGVTHPGVYNIGPLLRVTKYYIQHPSGILIEDESDESVESYDLHSPLIITHHHDIGIIENVKHSKVNDSDSNSQAEALKLKSTIMI